MPVDHWKRRALVCAVAVAALVVAACGAAPSQAPTPAPSPSASATQTPSPTPTPTPIPSASPTPAPSSIPSPSVQPDPAAALAIDPPYAASPLDPFIEAALEEQLSTGSGGVASALFDAGGVQINRDGKVAGYVFLMSWKGTDLSPTQSKAFFKGIRVGMRDQVGKLKLRHIKGTSVYFYGSGISSGAVMLLDGDVVIVAGLDPAQTRGIAKAVVTANA